VGFFIYTPRTETKENAMATKKVKTALPKSKTAQDKLAKAMKHSHYTFPTLTIRQAHILLECMKLGLDEGLIVDGEWVSGEEWMTLIETLINLK
jgi:hypothetical protein